MSKRPALSDLVQPRAVHRAAYTDPEVFAVEQDRIFRRTWLYVGHESEIPGFQLPQRRRRVLEIQAGFFQVRAMTFEALIGQDGPDVAVEIDLGWCAIGIHDLGLGRKSGEGWYSY